ncbi:YybS family protein [Selenomonas sp. F0473]|uniref:YybS family protein n=1 Tax=Selenomonas sp. F0473 TaxID=999423 RepID=UPI0025E3E021|nr:YybS family protein [Selenomonas sp. F0473]
MNEQYARPVATAGVMTAAASVYALAAIYLPMLTMVMGALWPVFVALVVVRAGLPWGLLMTAASLLILTLFATPAMGAFFVLAFAPTGLAIGALLRRHMDAVKVLMAGAGAALGGKLISAGLVLAIFGMNPLVFEPSEMSRAVEQTIDIYRALGMNEAQLTETRAAMERVMTTVLQMLPSLLVTSAVIEAGFSMTVLYKALARLGIRTVSFSPFEEWRLPVLFPYLFGFALVGLYWGATRDIALLYRAALNVYLIAFFAGLIQGLSLMHFMMKRFGLSPLVRTLLYVFVAVNAVITQVVSWTGLVDMVYDYRGKMHGET